MLARFLSFLLIFTLALAVTTGCRQKTPEPVKREQNEPSRRTPVKDAKQTD